MLNTPVVPEPAEYTDLFPLHWCVMPAQLLGSVAGAASGVMHAVADALDTSPVSHAVQLDAPAAGEMLPAEHLVTLLTATAVELAQ